MKFKKLLSFVAAAAMTITALSTSLSASVIGASAVDEVLPDSGSWQGTSNTGTSQLMLINNTTKTISALSGATEFYITFDVTGVDENTAAYIIYNISSGTNNWSPSEACPLTATPADGKYTVKYSGAAIKDTPGFSFLGVAFVNTANNNANKTITNVYLDSVTLTDPNAGSGSDSDISGTLTITANSSSTLTSTSRKVTTDVNINGAGSYTASVKFPMEYYYCTELGFFTYNGTGSIMIDVDSITLDSSNGSLTESVTFMDVLHSTGLIPAAEYSTDTGENAAALPRRGQYSSGDLFAVNEKGYQLKGGTFGRATLYNAEGNQLYFDTVTYNFTVVALDGDYITGLLNELSQAIADAEAIDITKYTDDTVAVLTSAIEAAKTYTSDSSALDIISAKSVLEAAVSGLVSKNVAITELITQAKTYKETTYTTSSYKALTDAMAAGEAVVAKGDEATLDEMQAALDTLNGAISGLKERADSDHVFKIQFNLNSYRNVISTNYTEESYAAYKEVLDKALYWNANPADATNEDIDQIFIDLETAKNALVLKPIDYSTLETAVAEAKVITDNPNSVDEYTPDSYQNLLTALLEGEALLAAQNASTQNVVGNAATAITYAISQLVSVDKTDMLNALAETIAKAEAFDEGKYTQESYAPLVTALEVAKVITSESTVEDIMSAQAALDTAIEGLVLDQVILPAGNPFGYIRYGWTDKPFYSGVTDEAAAGATQIKLTFDCASDTSYNSYYTIPVEVNIGETKTNVEMKGTSTSENLGEKGCSYVIDLTSAAEAGQAYSLTGYTYGYPSAADYVVAVTKIEFLDEDGCILYTITDKTIAQAELVKAIAEAEAIDTAKYTEESVTALTSAIEAAKALTDEATVEAINTAAKAITDAIAALKAEVDYTVLDKAIADGDAVVGTLYTKESYEVFASVLGKAKTIRNISGATQEDIDNVTKELTDAIAGLKLLATLTGTIFVSDEEAETEMTVKAVAADGTEISVTATSMGTYSIENFAAGDYTLTISGGKYATRSYEITVEGGEISQDVYLNPLGDINGDGKVTTADVGKANSHAKGVITLTDYDFVCGDVNNSGDITTADVGMINSHAKGVKTLW